MASSREIEAVLSKVHDQRSFFQLLLNQTLEWPTGDAEQVDDISYEWSPEELNAVGLRKELLDGPIWQIQPVEKGQPWGIFILEFKRPDLLAPRQGIAGTLRKVLRGLVSSRRKDPKLPSWKREHLLFICTHGWQDFRFAYFRPKPGESRSARLTTFGWTPETPNRTVCEFNLPALVWPDDPSDAIRWIDRWSKAFDKEPLTRDFFKRFDVALEAIKADLEHYQKLTSAEAYTQSQLLLERLIFLYFLQNRGWLDQNRTYLNNNLNSFLDKPDAFSGYKGFLDKLFWTLSTPPRSEGGRFPGIPFLNGGLFDDDDFAQPADTRKTNPPLKVRNRTLKRVFDELLEAFNFTVTEDTPLNQEVAVDPEMLGKVFESIVLHAEAADPDAIAPDKRKATGSYYTPRIVVHFICREALYQYLLNQLLGERWGPRLKALLEIDASDGIDKEEMERLQEILKPKEAVQILDLVTKLKCCDPAVGSGAFPVGLLHEFVNLRRLLEAVANGYVDPVRPEGSSWLHDTKADIVQNCLFGVDIQQQAIEICQLRLWLSLVVDYDLGLDPFAADRTRFIKAIEGISQLPNLEMNFRRGDSLHDHIAGVPIVILPEKSSDYAGYFQEIAMLGNELHTAKRAQKKRRLRLEILRKRLELTQQILRNEIKTIKIEDSALDGLFGLEESAAKRRQRNQQEIKRLEEALKKIGSDEKELEKLEKRGFDNQFYMKLRKLEGVGFDSPFNFAWRIDFPRVFRVNGGGFDIVVGNPPFVTARNPIKRQLWRQRWRRVCVGKYQLLCPFIELSFGLLRQGGQLSFIVSNAFARREFGKPLVEDFFPTVELQKLIDCSGLMFPGHGTPTCLLFGRNHAPRPRTNVRLVGILPSGGDLRTAPEESPLWHTIASNHDSPGYSDSRITVADRPRLELAKWPLNFDVGAEPTKKLIEERSAIPLRPFLSADVGFMFIVGRNDVFMLSGDTVRRSRFHTTILKPLNVGDEIRDYEFRGRTMLVFPYEGKNLELVSFPHGSSEYEYFKRFEKELSNRPTFAGTFAEEGRVPYEFHQIPVERAQNARSIAFAQISTHGHFVVDLTGKAFNEKAPLVKLSESTGDSDHHLVAGLLNSSAALFWLKQVCFSKRESAEAESDTYYEFAGGKVQELPLPESIVSTMKGKMCLPARRLAELSTGCWKRGQQMSDLAVRKQFEKPNEAYHKWNNCLPGHAAPNPRFGSPFESADSLCQAYSHARDQREQLWAEMVARQEEMDWLVYAAYGLLPEDSPAVQVEVEPEPLDQAQRPFRLWAQVDGDYAEAVALIPEDWSVQRRKLWEARLTAIRDNEHVRRIEQPVYKRRWDEQWKVGIEWRSGAIAYAAEFVDAYEWWLREKAEWWLENNKNGGPVELGEWVSALWKDNRIQAAWPVAAEQYGELEYLKAKGKAEENGEPVPARRKPALGLAGFKKAFAKIIDQETVPEGFPFGTSYDELQRKLKKKIPAKLKKVRGKLNVPRERFHQRGKTTYLWAGLQFR